MSHEFCEVWIKPILVDKTTKEETEIEIEGCEFLHTKADTRPRLVAKKIPMLVFDNESVMEVFNSKNVQDQINIYWTELFHKGQINRGQQFRCEVVGYGKKEAA